LTDKDLAARFQWDPNTVSKWRKRGIPLPKLMDAANELNVSMKYLLEDTSERSYYNSGFLFTLVPKVKLHLSAGDGRVVVDESWEDLYSFRTDWLKRKGQPSAMYLADISGNSMWPTLNDGDFVLFDTSKTEPRDGKIMVLGVEDHVFIKRLKLTPEGLYLVSDNASEYPPWRIDPEMTRIVGLVVWHCGEL
jgi:phage repressor protein C with HTH and peptisase S24 domain